jgi:hypothetical protein
MAESPENPRRSPRRAVNHRCPHCDKAYERPDHLARHLDSRKSFSPRSDMAESSRRLKVQNLIRSERTRLPMSHVSTRV